MSIAVYKAASRADRQHPTLYAAADTVKILAVSEKISLTAACEATRANSKSCLTFDLDDNKIDTRTDHILQHIVRTLISCFPHFRGWNYNAYTVGHYNGAIFPDKRGQGTRSVPCLPFGRLTPLPSILFRVPPPAAPSAYGQGESAAHNMPAGAVRRLASEHRDRSFHRAQCDRVPLRGFCFPLSLHT